MCDGSEPEKTARCARFTEEIPLRVMWDQWLRRVRLLSWPMRLAAVAVAVLAWVSQGMMNFGLNFFLHSFFQRSPNISGYFSNIGPAVVWAVLYAVPTVVYHVVTKTDVGYLKDKRIAFSLAVLGVIDSLGGFTATYASSHTPQFLQVIFISTGVMWTFGLTHLLIPSKARPLTLWPLIAFALIIAGFANIAIPEVSSMRRAGLLSDLPWWVVYFLSAVIPVTYNVWSGRYMVLVDEYTDGRRREASDGCAMLPGPHAPHLSNGTVGSAGKESAVFITGAQERLLNDQDAGDAEVVDGLRLPNPASIKMVMLTGDACVQVVAIVLLFPLDFTPWFGSHATPADSWRGLGEAWDCVQTCDGTLAYFITYTLGFWLNHVAFAFMNHHSPTLGAFVMAVYYPVNLLLLWLIPRWNVWGGGTPWYHVVPCFVCLALAAGLYFVYEESARFGAAMKQRQLEARGEAAVLHGVRTDDDVHVAAVRAGCGPTTQASS